MDESKPEQEQATQPEPEPVVDAKPEPKPRRSAVAEVADLRATLEGSLDELKSMVATGNERIAELEQAVGNLTLALPAVRAPLPREAVEEAIAANSHTRFEVLNAPHYKHGGMTLAKGRAIEAHLYPRLLDHVGNGLQLARL